MEILLHDSAPLPFLKCLHRKEQEQPGDRNVIDQNTDIEDPVAEGLCFRKQGDHAQDRSGRSVQELWFCQIQQKQDSRRYGKQKDPGCAAFRQASRQKSQQTEQAEKEKARAEKAENRLRDEFDEDLEANDYYTTEEDEYVDANDYIDEGGSYEYEEYDQDDYDDLVDSDDDFDSDDEQ